MAGFVACLAVGGLLAAAPSEPAMYFRVDGLKSADGLLRCGAFADEDNWLGDSPHASAQATIEDGEAICVFHKLEPGVYALTALHDADNNGTMTKSALGLPTEGYAASRGAARKSVARPAWKDARFRYRGGIKRLRARILYP